MYIHTEIFRSQAPRDSHPFHMCSDGMCSENKNGSPGCAHRLCGIPHDINSTIQQGIGGNRHDCAETIESCSIFDRFVCKPMRIPKMGGLILLFFLLFHLRGSLSSLCTAVQRLLREPLSLNFAQEMVDAFANARSEACDGVVSNHTDIYICIYIYIQMYRTMFIFTFPQKCAGRRYRKCTCACSCCENSRQRY